MFELSHFYNHCDKNDIDIIPYFGMPSPGATIRENSDIAIFLDFSQIRSTRLLRGVCCHELAHATTGSFHKVDSPFELAERAEYRANRWAAQHFLTVQDFMEAFASGYTELWQLADYFDFPEQDVKNALTYWTERKGIDFNTYNDSLATELYF